MNSNKTLQHVSVLSNAMDTMDMNDMTNTDHFHLRNLSRVILIRNLSRVILTDNMDTCHNNVNNKLENYTEKEKDALLDSLIDKMEEFEDVYSSNKYLDVLATKLMIKNLHDYKLSHN